MLYLILYLFVFANCIQAQGNKIVLKAGKDYVLYSEKDGLAGNLISDVATDLTGYTWMATNKGLSRFDGLHFVNFPLDSNATFFSDRQVNKLYHYQNYLYLISFSQGCIRLDLNTYHFSWVSKIGVKDLFHLTPTNFALIHTNGVLQLFNNGKVFQRKFGREVNAAITGRNSFLYVGLPGLGLFKFSAVNLSFIKRARTQFNASVPKLFWTKDNKINFRGGFENYLFDENLTIEKHLSTLTNATYINSFSWNSTGDFYSIINGVNFNIHLNGKDFPISFDGFVNAELRCIVHSTEPYYWIGTNQGVLKVKELSSSIKVIDDNHLFNNKVIRVRRKIIEAPNKDLFFLGYPNIILKRAGELTKISHPPISSYDGFLFRNQLFFVAEGNLFCKLNMADFSYDFQKVPAKIYNGNLFSLCLMDSTHILLGGAKGIFTYHIPSNSFSKINTQETTLNDINIHSIISYKENYFISSNKGLFVVNFSKNKASSKDFTISKFFKIPLQTDLVKSVLIVADYSQLWVATTNGIEILNLYNYSPIQFLNEENGLPSKLVTEMIRDDKARVWISTYKGITSMSIALRTYFNLTKELGCSNYEYNYKSGIRLSNGKIIFGGLNAYDEIDPKLFDNKKSTRKLSLTSYTQNNKNSKEVFVQSVLNTQIHYLFGANYLQLFFSPFDYMHSEGYQYEYSVDGNDWIKMNKDGSLILTNLEPGLHYVYSRSIDPNGAYIFGSFAIPVLVDIQFYKEKWFLLFLLFLIIVFGLGVIISLVLSKRKEARLKSRISMDLHDEIGTIINRSLMMLNNQSDTAKVVSNLSEALFALRIYIKTLKHKQYPFSALNDDLQHFLTGFFDNSSYMLNFINYVPDNLEISSELFRDIRLCVYEVSNNTMKHANGNMVTFTMAIINNELIVRFSDNGKLLDVNTIFAKGNGISNIGKRVKRNAGKLDFSLNNSHGLLLQMCFKL